jgi:hypothetical protein
LNKWLKSKKLEREVLLRARILANQLGLEMKITDCEFRADGKKVTVFYTADGRIDFRELVRLYASEFRVRIEMKQIGSPAGRRQGRRIGLLRKGTLLFDLEDGYEQCECNSCKSSECLPVHLQAGRTVRKTEMLP